MWTDNLPEVRRSSLAIATHIVNHSGSPLSIKQNIAGGMWNLAVIILLDGKECCLVREQVKRVTIDNLGSSQVFSVLLPTIPSTYHVFKSFRLSFYLQRFFPR